MSGIGYNRSHPQKAGNVPRIALLGQLAILSRHPVGAGNIVNAILGHYGLVSSRLPPLGT